MLSNLNIAVERIVYHPDITIRLCNKAAMCVRLGQWAGRLHARGTTYHLYCLSITLFQFSLKRTFLYLGN